MSEHEPKSPLPQIYDPEQRKWRVPTANEMIESIRGILVDQLGMNAQGALEKARRLVFGFQDETPPKEKK